MAMGITNNLNSSFYSTYGRIYEAQKQQAFKPRTPGSQESGPQSFKPGEVGAQSFKSEESGLQAPKFKTSNQSAVSKMGIKETAAIWKNAGTTTDKGAYLNELSKLAPSVKFRIGYTHASAKSGKTLTINPKLMERMQNDPEFEKEMKELIKGVELMTKFSESLNRATGWTTVFRHGYIDENGKYTHFAIVRNDAGYKMSAKLRQERRIASENLAKRIKEKTAIRKKSKKIDIRI